MTEAEEIAAADRILEDFQNQRAREQGRQRILDDLAARKKKQVQKRVQQPKPSARPITAAEVKKRLRSRFRLELGKRRA